VERSRQTYGNQLARIWSLTVEQLCDGPQSPEQPIDALFDVSKIAQNLHQEKSSLLVFCTLHCRTMLQYLFGDYAQAVTSGRQAQEHAQAAQGLLYQANHCFYYALALLAQHATTQATEPG
jgi:predicted ATPase